MVDLEEVRARLLAVEPELDGAIAVPFHTFTRDGRALHLHLTTRLRRMARKQGLWRSRELLITLKNAAYGFDGRKPRSAGGRDGVFLLDRTRRPPNAMMRKLFAGYLDKPGSGAEELAAALGATVEELIPVRLVSHHLRLLGVLVRQEDGEHLALVDLDVGE